tara:strand:- start:1362 stop:2135 length:774 start_codon:yes stop_codon:yes gene_type:complete
MTSPEPLWGEESRFYLPNEDAGVVCRAISFLEKKPRHPLFVCGSGMVALEVISRLDTEAVATLVDVSGFQIDFFKKLSVAIKRSEKPKDIINWFKEKVYPYLCKHFDKRGEYYPIENILSAIREIFRISFFSDIQTLENIQSRVDSINLIHEDIAGYLAKTTSLHDFVYLSNLPDYLSEDECAGIFSSCARIKATVYLLLTESCKNKEAVKIAWANAGYIDHPLSEELTADNRGLGSKSLKKKWNRKGSVHLLLSNS